MKKIILNGNITTSNVTANSIEYNGKSTGTNSSTKCWKAVSLKPSFAFSVEIWSWFSSLVCFSWILDYKFLRALF